MIKKLFISIALLLGLLGSASASHYMGGEIYWKCQPNGQYKFYMRVYQECAGILYSTGSEQLSTNVPGLTTITLYYVDSTDISPNCYPGTGPLFPHLNCETTTVSNTGGVREWIYESNPVSLPAGPPPATGWVFSYTGCCRNPCTNISNTSSMDWFLRAIMYPYPSATYNTCWDNSPSFLERPSTVICTGYPFSYNPNAYDIELDSLAYEWAQPWTGNNTPIPAGSYNGTYSWNSPLPGPGLNPNNVAATVNPNTGEVSFTSFTSGAFVTVNKVSAFRCGVKVAEIFREMQVVLLPCPGNDPPTVIIQYPNGDTLSNYVDTVFAGAMVSYNMWAFDGQMLNDTFTPQTIKVTATGTQLGLNGISTTTGCLNPPCAIIFWGDTINPMPLPALGIWALNTQFRWQTSCSHLATDIGCGGVSNVYNFIVATSDDYCPAPAIRWTTITIVVKNAIMPPPSPRCITTEPNGHLKLSWVIPDTIVIPNTWNAYLIYRSTNINGPYTLIDSLKTANNYYVTSTNWTDLTAHGNDTVYYYYMQTRSGCYGNYFSAYSDTLSNMLLNSTNTLDGHVLNQWNPISNPLPPTSTGKYSVLFRYNSVWSELDTSYDCSAYSLVNGCGYIKFRISLADASGCSSMSNIDSALFQTATPPFPHCLAVEPNGSVTVTFEPPADTNLTFFSAYLFYSSDTPTSGYNLVDSITNPAQFVKNISAINANDAPEYLYIINRIYCDGYFYSNTSDTLKTLFLSITSLNPLNSQLFWNVMHVPPIPSASNQYDIYRGFPVGDWNHLTQTPLLTATDNLVLCDDTIPYRIEMADAIGCVSVSNVAKTRYYDNIPPPIPLLDTVSIDSITGFTHISWLPNSPETSGYLIFWDNGGTLTLLDTVWGTNTTHYVDNTSPGNGCDAPKSYVIAAIDSCWLTSGMGIDKPHNTIHLEIAHIDPCGAKITLSWNPYQNMVDTLGGYRVYVSDNGAPWTLLGNVLPAGPGFPVPTTFTHEGFVQDRYYCYSVQAYNNSNTRTSSSCKACIFATKPKQPQFIFLRNATVKPDNTIDLKLHTDTSAYVTEYRILRAYDKPGPYQLAGKLPSSWEPDLIYNDESVDPANFSYYYAVTVIDSCGLEVLHSDTARTILLTVEPKANFTNRLDWNDYEGWTWSFVKGYQLYRSIDGMTDPIPIATVPYGKQFYVDDVSGYFDTQGKFQYYLEALEGPGSLAFNDTSYSNAAADVQPSHTYIPNAFSPKGYNNIFKPISIYADTKNYYFVIYNRMGEMLFETRDPSEGWDGTYEGDYVPLGVYIYYVKFTTSGGEKFEKRATVTVIK